MRGQFTRTAAAVTFTSTSGAIGNQTLGSLGIGFRPSGNIRGSGHWSGVGAFIAMTSAGNISVEAISGSGGSQTFAQNSTGAFSLVYRLG